MTRRCRWAAVLLVVAGLTGACSDAGGAPEVAAVVEGATIPAAQTEALLETHVRNELAPAGSAAGEFDGDRRRTLTHFVLLYQIKHALLRHLARGLDISVDARNLGPEAEAGRLSEAMAQRLFPDVAEAERQGRFLEWFDQQLRVAEVRVDRHFGHWDPGRGVVQ
jgi:hypothetical protein